MRYTTEAKAKLITRYQKGESISTLSLQTGIARSTLYSWIKPYATLHTPSSSFTNIDYAKMKKHIAKLEDMIEILQKVNCHVDSPLQEKLYELEKLYGQYSVHALCDALKVPRGTLYNHVLRNKKQNNSYQIRRDELSAKIEEIFHDSNQTYGARKINAVLAEQGIITSPKMVSQLMDEMNLVSIRSRAKKDYKLYEHKQRDLIRKNFTADAPNKIWVSDVTQFRVKENTYYICAILDLFSRKVIAYKIATIHSTQLITATFKAAFAERKPELPLTFHSDRGSQYTSHAFQKLLHTLGVEQSFSPPVKPHNNAAMESFFSSMKKEELYHFRYHSVAEFQNSVHRYFEFYNNKRPHSTDQYKSPNAYEIAFWEQNIKE